MMTKMAKRLLLTLFVYCVISRLGCVLGQDRCINETDDGNVRLVNRVHRDKLEGRLELCLDGLWGSVCNDEWDIENRRNAKVVCRQLGVAEDDLADVVTGLSFGGGPTTQPIHLDTVSCDGTESSLLNCSHATTHDCGKSEDVGIICERSEDCTDGDVRLMDGAVPTEGRVEYCIGGQWGTVCDVRTNPEWDESDVGVVCRQLGHFTLEPRVLSPVPRLPNSRLNTPIAINEVHCTDTGRENELEDCQLSKVVEFCSHNDDVGANCTRDVECVDNDIRLVAGDTDNEGIVEFCRNGYWGEICQTDWDTDDATVVCRQLGFNINAGNPLTHNFGLGKNFRRLYLTNVACLGNENSLTECSHTNGSDAGVECILPSAGVICPTARECVEGDVRLMDGRLSNQIGRAEVCLGGRWGQICDDDWDNKEAAVFCRQLGFTGGIATVGSAFSRHLTESDVIFVLEDLKCAGNETSITDCEQDGKIGDCKVRRNEVAGIICGNDPGESLEMCPLEHDNNTLSVEDTTVNISIASYGMCEEYDQTPDICNRFFTSNDYVFINHTNQEALAAQLERALRSVRTENSNCSDLIATIACHYFFTPCGSGDEVYRPTPTCSEECEFVEEYCADMWSDFNSLLQAVSLPTIDCNTTNRYGGLSPCCINAGIQVMNITTTTPLTVTPSPDPTRGSAAVIGGVAAAVVFCALLVIILGGVVLFLCAVISRKRKVVRNLQMEVLSSPTARTASTDMLAGFIKKADEIDSSAAKATGSVKLRNGSLKDSVRGPLAVPNPYATKQELIHELPPELLSPNDNKMMNRISSSIIRELTSNMLIPYTRLKLLECVGQGEFGVVYKADYTEPEGDISYKTSTVAVKTLKGFFDNDQVNKIMSESVKMKHFDHPNVLHLIGVCLDAGPAPYVVMPFMANGSLLHYLKKERSNIVLPHEVDEDVKIDVRKRLTVMCLQIANGMEYLAQEKFVHRDLAARNCMIDIHFVIKIADFGLSEDVYSKNYFRQNTSDKHVKLPVKWMAPESLSDGVFSEKTDVWSFGVTCWEIFSGGKTPYPGMDPLLLSQMLDTEQRLNKPLNAACPDEIYAMMMHTWAKKPDDRPTFTELITTISNYTEKIAGYLDVNFNPFQSTTDLTAIANGGPKEEVEDKSILTSPEQLIAALDQPKKKSKSSSPKVSPRVSPRVSPLPSPRVTPRGPSPSNMSQEDKNSVGIKITIDSPSDNGSTNAADETSF